MAYILNFSQYGYMSLQGQFVQNVPKAPLFSQENRTDHASLSLILPAALYGYEAWSLNLKEEYRLKMYQNKVLRRIFDLRRKWSLEKIAYPGLS
jgi:hypothetical protein